MGAAVHTCRVEEEHGEGAVEEAVGVVTLYPVRRSFAGVAYHPVGVVDQDTLVLQHQVVLAAGTCATSKAFGPRTARVDMMVAEVYVRVAQFARHLRFRRT